MRRYKVVILNRIDQDNLIVKAKSLDKIKPIAENPIKPKNPRKSLDERITEAIIKAIQPIITRLEKIENRLDKIEVRLDRNNIY